MKIKIHELASQEFDDAIEWYNLQSKELGNRFKKAVICQLKKIKQTPDWFLLETEDIFKAYIPKFPYKVLYTRDKDRGEHTLYRNRNRDRDRDRDRFFPISIAISIPIVMILLSRLVIPNPIYPQTLTR